MIPTIYDKTGNTKYGELVDCIKGIVIEERNGLFQAEVTYCLFSPHWDKLIRGNIIIADANDTLKNQKFRINKISKPINGQFTVKARHISFDLARDMIEGLDIENQSCEYCLNQIFRSSQFSQHYRGYSDIVASQNFKITATKVLKSIAGEEGSIIDTFGTGAELLRDNTNIHVLNKRGHDNGVTIEYGKNLTGITLDEDDSNMITRIKGYAKYRNDNGEEIVVYTSPKYIDSSRILEYETPFIEEIDFSSSFNDDEIPTAYKVKEKVLKYFEDTKCDYPNTNAKISFIPLSKCVGYEGLEDKISLCDTVTIKDYRYGYEDKAKVIKVTYDFIKERYESMEVGDPRNSINNILGNSVTVGPPGPPGADGKPGADGNIGDFPDSLPETPILSSKLYGFANIELSWTFENKVYYSYQLYASKTRDFIPNVFDLIHEGQSSSFLFQAKPEETWYFRVCCVNSHGNRTEFSNQIAVTTTKVDNLSNYFEEAAIGNAVVGALTADYMEAGIIKGNWIDAKQLSVTDSNGLRTLWIDSYGQVDLNVRSFKISNKQVYTADESDSAIVEAVNGVKVNILPNGSFNDGNTGWNKVNITIGTPSFYNNERNWCNFYTTTSAGERYGENIFDILPNKVYNFSMLLAQYSTSKTFYRIRVETKNKNSDVWTVAKEFTGNTSATRSKPEQLSYSFKSASTVEKCRIWIGKLDGEVFDIYVSDLFMGTGTIYARKSEFEILDDKITSKVDVDGVKSAIEQNPDSVQVGFNKINDNFKIDANGVYLKGTDGKEHLVLKNGRMYVRDINGSDFGYVGRNNWKGTNIYGMCVNMDAQTSFSVGFNDGDIYNSKFVVCNSTISPTGGTSMSPGLHMFSDLYTHDYRLIGTQKITDINHPNGSNKGTLNIWTPTTFNGWNISTGNIYAQAISCTTLTQRNSLSTFSVDSDLDMYSSDVISIENIEQLEESEKYLTTSITPNTEWCGTANIINGVASIDLPLDVQYKDYTVQLTAIGRNTVYLMHKNDDNFIVESDNDCRFDFIVKFENIERTYARSLCEGTNKQALICPDEGKEKEKENVETPLNLISGYDEVIPYWQLYTI